MNIGVINKKSFSTIDGNGNQKVNNYNEMIVDVPFMPREIFTITPNKEKRSEGAADFTINRSINEKGENYRRQRVGSLWNKVTDDGKPYKSGSIESPIFPSGELRIAIFEAKVFEGEDPAKITWTHEVSWKPYKPKDENTQNTQAPRQIEIPEVTVEDDEVPF